MVMTVVMSVSSMWCLHDNVFSGGPGLKMTSVYWVECWYEVGVGVVLRLGPPTPVCLLHAQASTSTIA